MAGIIQYTLSLNDRVSEKMKKIGVENMKQVEGWNKVQQKVQTTEQVMQKCADSVGSVVSRINGLQDAILSSILSPFASLPAQIMSVFDPVFEWIHGAIDAVGVWFENNKELITGIMTVIAGVISSVVNVVGQAVSVVVGTFGEFWARVQEGDPIATRLAATMGILATALLVAAARAKLMAMWSGIVSAAKAVWAAVQGGLNLALLACPITWIITAIIALIAVIAYVCYKVEGWGTLWSGVIGIMKYGFLSFVESIKLAFTAMTNGIMIGLDKIKIGWYKFKNAVGLGNKEENQAAIDRLDADIKQRKDKISEGADKVAEYTRLAAESARSIDLTWNNDKKLSDITDGFKKKLGIGDPSLPGMTEGDVPGGGGQGEGVDAGGTVDAIATGGSRNTSVHINLQSLVENIVFNGGYDGNAEDMQKDLESRLIQILMMARTAQ